MEQFGKHGVKINHWNDEDKIKHCTYDYFINHNKYKLTSDSLHNVHIIYMYCDPALAIASYYRRNFAKAQHYKLNRSREEPSSTAAKCGRYASIPDTFQQYVNTTIESSNDSFNYLRHITQWMSAPKIYPMTLEDIVKNKEQLSSKLSVSTKLFDGIKIKPRSSKHNTSIEFRKLYLQVFNDARILSRKYLNNNLKKI